MKRFPAPRTAEPQQIDEANSWLIDTLLYLFNRYSPIPATAPKRRDKNGEYRSPFFTFVRAVFTVIPGEHTDVKLAKRIQRVMKKPPASAED